MTGLATTEESSGVPRRRILLIDDNRELVSTLANAVLTEANGLFDIDTWVPGDDAGADANPLSLLDMRVSDETVLVATDEDLTSSLRGFFGSTVVNWCKVRLIPVGNFSRALTKEALSEPGLFDFRLSRKTETAAKEIVNIVHGFMAIEDALKEWLPGVEAMATPASALAHVLDDDHGQSDFAPYLTKVGAANGALLTALKAVTQDGSPAHPGAAHDPSQDEKARVLTYVLGHVLRNGVLAYPGPIISLEALCAYCAVGESDAGAIATIFKPASYLGPFASEGEYYWRHSVDEILDGAPASDTVADTFDAYNKIQLTALLDRQPGAHGCLRCNGTRGGFWCPFTRRPVCDRADCSVPSSSWIPYGADLCRIERDFYEEWAPLMGY